MTHPAVQAVLEQDHERLKSWFEKIRLEEEGNAVDLDLQRQIFDRLDCVEELPLANESIGSHRVADQLDKLAAVDTRLEVRE